MPQFCAAAALVVGASRSVPDRERLVERMEHDGIRPLIDRFEELGWSRQLGEHILALNDAFDPAERKARVLQLLA